PFIDLRVKIHGQPESADIKKVREFRQAHKERMAAADLELIDQLILDLEKQFKPFDINALNQYITRIPAGSALHKDLLAFQQAYGTTDDVFAKIELLVKMLDNLRFSVLDFDTPKTRLAIMDISINLEDLLFKEAGNYTGKSPKDELACLHLLARASAACGYLESWEWDQSRNRLTVNESGEMGQADLFRLLQSYRSILEWGTGMFVAVYNDVVTSYNGFESLASGFTDDRIRSSLLLQIGNRLSKLSDKLADQLPAGNSIFSIEGQSSARGLNPGFARGELVVVQGPYDILEIDKNKIYVFNKPPSDLKPVAGILTVSEGNPVSHVQLLARNLGIPNAVISMQVLEALSGYAGQDMFYAVSSRGVIVLKREKDMSAAEKMLFEKKQRSTDRITVPVEKINISENRILNLRDVDASSSGIICGPKAANLGQLKKLFPDKVVEGLVIPFGIFREHLQQQMPGQEVSYWVYLNNIFDQSRKMENEGAAEQDIENFVMKELNLFREAISRIKLSPELIQDIRKKFIAVFGAEPGKVPVFLRSDTNMEDLKDFTGAGLNLTLFNIVDEASIIKGIRDVWASPYTERSFKWRQRYLLNPENVFPSILIIPSVNVDYSGVLITKGVGMGDPDDATAAFNLGVGGAVEGQMSETYLLRDDGTNILLAPARETEYKVLPLSGGVKTEHASFEEQILKPANLVALRQLVKETRKLLPAYGSQGPYDIELGFKDDKIWLFQVRPFVENKEASGQLYLESLNPVFENEKIIDLSKPLP
ncbi:MAG TPA: PEP/pyruvate-binding domain-containing protein, partial [Bacteroidales bacterium]|nr:PEP/pyruvate-binding domain-containing protein [Bacteroidales bacterium]